MQPEKRFSISPAQLILAGDLVIMECGLLFAMLIVGPGSRAPVFSGTWVISHLGITFFLGLGFWTLFKVHHRIVRYFHIEDYIKIITLVFVIHILSWIFDKGFAAPHYRIYFWLFSFLVTSMGLVFSRLLISYYINSRGRRKNGVEMKRLLIYGAGEQGRYLARRAEENNGLGYEVLGFLDDDVNLIGKFIKGKPVYSASEGLANTIVDLGVTDIFIAILHLGSERKSDFLKQILEFNIRVKQTPSLDSWLSRGAGLERLMNLDINDLLGRQPLDIRSERVVEFLQGKSVLVTGAAGSIGSEIARQVAVSGVERLICLDFAESALFDLQQELKTISPELEKNYVIADIRHPREMGRVMDKYNPQVIFHAAAYKHVPLMESFPWQAVETNVLSTYRLAKLAGEYGVEKFVLISSDKAVHPTNIMGATKRLAEITVRSLSDQYPGTVYVTTRFGNVLGSNGSVVPLFKKQLMEGKPLTVTHPDMVRYFMTIPEACQLVMEAATMSRGKEIFVFDMGQPMKILDLARNMIRLAGYIPEVEVPIQFIGKRPGEKMYEDLFAEAESMLPTHHPKIMIGKTLEYDAERVNAMLARLMEIQERPEVNALAYKILIKELLPEYSPSDVPEGQRKPVLHDTSRTD